MAIIRFERQMQRATQGAIQLSSHGLSLSTQIDCRTYCISSAAVLYVICLFLGVMMLSHGNFLVGGLCFAVAVGLSTAALKYGYNIPRLHYTEQNELLRKIDDYQGASVASYCRQRFSLFASHAIKTTYPTTEKLSRKHIKLFSACLSTLSPEEKTNMQLMLNDMADISKRAYPTDNLSAR